MVRRHPQPQDDHPFWAFVVFIGALIVVCLAAGHFQHARRVVQAPVCVCQ